MAFGDVLGTFTGGVTTLVSPVVGSGSAAVSVGDLVIALSSQESDREASSCSDNLGNTYTSQNGGTKNSTIGGRMWYSRVTVAGTITSVSIAYASIADSTTNASTIAAAFAGPFASPPIDVNVANKTSDATSPFTCTTTGTLSQADELVIAWLTAGGSTSTAATSPNLLAVQRSITTNATAAIGYQVVAATTAVIPEFTKASNPSNTILGTASFKKAVTALSLTADSGSFTFTGTAATLKYGREVAADSGAFTFTGTAATLSRIYILAAGSGSYEFTGSAADLTIVRAYVLSTDVGSFFFNGTAASLEYGHILVPDSGSFSFDGTDATLLRAHRLDAGNGAFAFTGSDVALQKTWVLSPDSGAFVFTGSDAALRRTIAALAAESGGFVFTGTAASLERGYEVVAGPGQFFFNGGAEVTLNHSGEDSAPGLNDWIVRNRHRGRR